MFGVALGLVFTFSVVIVVPTFGTTCNVACVPNVAKCFRLHLMRWSPPSPSSPSP